MNEPPLKSRIIALVGFGENTQPPEAVWNNPAIEKWTLNHGHGLNPNWDRLFEFHDRSVIELESREHFRGVDQWAALANEKTRPIYMKAVDEAIPCSVRFPIEHFTAFFGQGCEKLLRSPYAEMAVAYMMGLAIMKLNAVQDGEIYIYGFELFDGTEYQHQRACFEFYAGFALGRDIRLVVPEASAIFANRGLYEYDTGKASEQLNLAERYLKARFEEMKGKFADASRRNADAIAEMQTISGIMQEVEQNLKMVQHLLRGGSYS